MTQVKTIINSKKDIKDLLTSSLPQFTVFFDDLPQNLNSSYYILIFTTTISFSKTAASNNSLFKIAKFKVHFYIPAKNDEIAICDKALKIFSQSQYQIDDQYIQAPDIINNKRKDIFFSVSKRYLN